MFIAVRKYRVQRGSTAEWAQRVRDGFVPLMRELTGFRGYYLLDGGPDEVIAISMFDSAGEALMSNEKAADWMRNNVKFARGIPEIMVGDVLVAEVK
jgi:heme-degrading monooxygenase HmoA